MELATFVTQEEMSKILAISSDCDRVYGIYNDLFALLAFSGRHPDDNQNKWYTAMHNPDKSACDLDSCKDVLKWYGNTVRTQTRFNVFFEVIIRVMYKLMPHI